MTTPITIPVSVIAQVTDVSQERNIYAHPNPVARWIFWQRLVVGHALLSRHARRDMKVLDFGGGSGSFLPALTSLFTDVSVADLDLNDARRIAAHYGLGNVRFHEGDVSQWTGAERYDVVTAMDVLEHFLDKSVPKNFFDAHLKPGGLLLVSLPTENLLYELGRIVVRKTKPADHYYSARELVRYYREAGYQRIVDRFVPRIGPAAVPLFYIGLFRSAA